MTIASAGPARIAGAAFVGLALAAAVAGGGWSFAAGRANAAISSWIAQEAAAGRVWSCPDRRTQGFPTRLEIVCPKLGFEGAVLDRPFAGSVGGFTAHASLWRPQTVEAQLAAPFSAATPEGDHFTLDWRRLDLVLDGAAQGFRAVAVSGEGFSLSGADASGAPLDFSAASAQASLRPGPGAPGEAPPSYEFEATVAGAGAPTLAALLALKAPVDANVSGAIVGLDLAKGGSLLERLERWRLAGGRVDFSQVRIVSGEALLEAKGGFDLDEARRPRGEFDARLSGLEATLRQFGVSPALIAGGSLLTSFLTGSPGREDRTKTIRLPVRLADGVVSVGPLRLPSLRLPPLY